jgi:hypothetical protein
MYNRIVPAFQYGDSSIYRPRIIVDIGLVYEAGGNAVEAVRLFRQAQDGFRLMVGHKHHDMLCAVKNMRRARAKSDNPGVFDCERTPVAEELRTPKASEQNYQGRYDACKQRAYSSTGQKVHERMVTPTFMRV